ncbi:YcxB family protein [Plantactinospora sp. B5E13]|uniref:YcxB family protein n=1 Tax=unclassified Plantactinospora TaxID=2631981 RepID=UPI00325F7A45
MTVTFEVTADPRAWVRATRRAMRPYLLVIWVGSALVVLGGGTIVALDPADPGEGIQFIVLGLVLLSLGPLLPRLSVRMQKWLLTPPITITVSDEKLASRSATSSSEFVWSAVRRVQETDDMWLVRLGHTHLLMLPKDGTDETGRQEFRRLLVDRGLAR